jgi:hypothetical protein
MTIFKFFSVAAIAVFFLSGCASIETKMEAFPKMYDENSKPLSIVVVPSINKTTAADAAELINATLTQPFADSGYYVLPIAISSEIFRREGVVAGEQLLSAPMSIFKDNFGADAVLFITINKWDKNYMVVAANVTVGMSYVLMSTKDREILWSYDAAIVVDTSGQSSGFILLDLVKTAITTAATDYVPIATQVNNTAVTALPFGAYHPKSGEDRDLRVVLTKSKEKALEAQ